MLSPKKAPPSRTPIEAADKPALLPAFHRVNLAAPEQFAVEIADGGVDPGFVARDFLAGAGGNHGIEVMIDPDLERA